jgi:hypothetical protein
MSYLIGPRVHFAGRFRTDVSTVNNFVTHFQDPNSPDEPGWNPEGSARWSLVGCTVRRVVYRDGTIAHTTAEDPVVGMALNQVDRAVMVDLDPEQQLASQIWALRMQLGSPGAPAFGGAFKTTAFSDLWFARAPSGPGGDANMSAFYQSVLGGVAWGNVAGSRLLSELRESSDADLLSVKFNIDGFDQSVHVGRIVGTIGPAHADEPANFVRGRHCMPEADGAPINYFPALVDAQRGKLVADFGNALQTTSSGGPFDSSLDIEIGMGTDDQYQSLGKVPVGDGDWYEQTAGICEFPADRALTADELGHLESTPLTVQLHIGDKTGVLAREGRDGIHVRAEDFVYRMSVNDTATVTLHASQFGKPLPNATIDVTANSSGLQRGDVHPLADPASGLTYPASVSSDADGVAAVPLRAGSIGTPRGYIDGQLYGVGYAVRGTDPNQGSYVNPWNFVSALVWTDYHAPHAPAWKEDVEPILSEYAQLYPVMKDIVDLSDYDSVVDSKSSLQDVFNLPQDSPHYMPITRDLSPAKRQMILAWLLSTGNAGKPTFQRHVGAAVVPAPTPPAAKAAASPSEAAMAALGGKTAALQRRGDHPL